MKFQNKSQNSQTPKKNISQRSRMLTQSEIDLLRKDLKEASQQAKELIRKNYLKK